MHDVSVKLTPKLGKPDLTGPASQRDVWSTRALRDPRADQPAAGVVKPRVKGLVDLFEGG